MKTGNKLWINLDNLWGSSKNPVAFFMKLTWSNENLEFNHFISELNFSTYKDIVGSMVRKGWGRVFKKMIRESYGGPVVRTQELPLQGPWVWSLVGELDPLRGTAKKWEEKKKMKNNNKKNQGRGTSLVVQWIRIHLPMQGTQVRSLVREDLTCCRATKPARLQLLSLCSATRGTAATRSPCTHRNWRTAPACHN